MKFGRRGRVVLAIVVVVVLGPVAVLIGSVVPPMASAVVHRYRAPDVTPLALSRARAAALAGEPLDIQQTWRPLAEVSPYVPRAVIAGEDSRFYEHRGFDWEEIQNARREAERREIGSAWRAWRGGKPLRGASTITQQTARTVYLSTSRSPIRKLREAILTVWLELVMPKDRILELYLNWVELGPGVFGVEAASQHYFGVSASRLGRERAAMLAATLPAPRAANPANPTRGFWRRHGRILDRMIRWYGP